MTSSVFKLLLAIVLMAWLITSGDPVEKYIAFGVALFYLLKKGER